MKINGIFVFWLTIIGAFFLSQGIHDSHYAIRLNSFQKMGIICAFYCFLDCQSTNEFDIYLSKVSRVFCISYFWLMSIYFIDFAVDVPIYKNLTLAGCLMYIFYICWSGESLILLCMYFNYKSNKV